MIKRIGFSSKRKGAGALVSGAAILGAGAFIAKLLGALYRIPLTRIIGAKGLGIYQMIFPVYALLLEFSGAAVPNAVAKIISSYRGEISDKHRYAISILKTSVRFFAVLGSVLSVSVAVLAGYISKAQGNSEATLSYIAMSPSIFLVCILCCYRGYFQGQTNMMPTAVSQIAEQAVKLAAGLLLASFFLPDIAKAAAGAALALTLSEAVAVVYVFIVYKRQSKGFAVENLRVTLKETKDAIKEILKYTVPIAFAGILLPLSKVADSFIIINVISAYDLDATALFGLFSGVAVTVVGLPVAVCYGFAAAAVPAVSSEGDSGKNAAKSIVFTFIISTVCAVGCFLFAPFIINILYGYLSAENKIASIRLLKISSPCIVLLSVLQTVNAVFIGKGRPKTPLIGLAFGVVFKLVLEILLVSDPEINIYGAAYGAIACYFCAVLINLICLARASGKKTVVKVKSRDGYPRYNGREGAVR